MEARRAVEDYEESESAGGRLDGIADDPAAGGASKSDRAVGRERSLRLSNPPAHSEKKLGVEMNEAGSDAKQVIIDHCKKSRVQTGGKIPRRG